MRASDRSSLAATKAAACARTNRSRRELGFARCDLLPNCPLSLVASVRLIKACPSDPAVLLCALSQCRCTSVWRCRARWAAFESDRSPVRSSRLLPSRLCTTQYAGDLIMPKEAKEREKKYDEQGIGCYMFFFYHNGRQRVYVLSACLLAVCVGGLHVHSDAACLLFLCMPPACSLSRSCCWVAQPGRQHRQARPRLWPPHVALQEVGERLPGQGACLSWLLAISVGSDVLV
jgi:hypothetical protein